MTLAATSDEDVATSKDKSLQDLINLAINRKALSYFKSFDVAQDPLKETQKSNSFKRFCMAHRTPARRVSFHKGMPAFPSFQALMHVCNWELSLPLGTQGWLVSRAIF